MCTIPASAAPIGGATRKSHSSLSAWLPENSAGPSERAGLTELARCGKAAAYKITHARILLKADAAPGGPGWQDEQIADALDVGTATVELAPKRLRSAA